MSTEKLPTKDLHSCVTLSLENRIIYVPNERCTITRQSLIGNNRDDRSNTLVVTYSQQPGFHSNQPFASKERIEPAWNVTGIRYQYTAPNHPAPSIGMFYGQPQSEDE
ncbi:hypothetical protein HYV86_03605 [Candidatus Woesearchaeota archaeon]|nr:hypothetical protein [Candidatus Woesearchaeota archaeon]